MALILGLITLAVYLAETPAHRLFHPLLLSQPRRGKHLFFPSTSSTSTGTSLLFFFVPVAIGMLRVVDYFSYRKAIQFAAAALFTFFL